MFVFKGSQQTNEHQLISEIKTVQYTINFQLQNSSTQTCLQK